MKKLFLLILFFTSNLFSFEDRVIQKYTDRYKGEERANILVKYLYGFPEKTVVKREWSEDDRTFLLTIASDTWKYFYNIVDKNTHLPLDQIHIAPEKFVGDYTNITNVGLYIISIISGYDFGFISREEALQRVENTINITETREKYRGFHYNYYDTTTMERTSHFISFVDSGWYIVGLIIARQTFPELKPRIDKIIESSNFKFFYDSKTGLMYHGFNTKEKKYSEYHYGMFYTEPRVISAMAIAKGDVPVEHWFKMHRALPKDWKWQKQIPQGKTKTYYIGKILGRDVIYTDKDFIKNFSFLTKPKKVKVFQGYYTYSGMKIVPSWGGSMFEGLMPLMVINEQKYAPESLGLNNKNYVLAHIKYAIEEKKYPVWGGSPCSVPGGGYGEYGVPYLGARGYTDEVVTPHASFLALMVFPEEAIKNLRKMLELYPDIYGEYGFYDSVNVVTGEISKRYLLLDQAMSFIALNNYLNNGIIQKRFEKDEIGKRIKSLIKVEKFFGN